MKHFENRFFLVAPLYKEAHATVYTIGTRTKEMYTNLFDNYWNQGYFLTWNGLYVYKVSDISQEEIYLKKRITTFFKELSYGVFSQDEASKIHLKLLIKTRMLMDAHTKEDMKVIFCKLLVFLSFSVTFCYLQFFYL